MRKWILAIFILGLFFFSVQVVSAQTDYICVVYFTGVGCSHCAKVDPLVLEELPREYDNFIVIEYEIYQQRENALLLYQYNEQYNSGLGIPLIIFDKEEQIAGDRPILNNTRGKIESLGSNQCLLLGGVSVDFNKLNIKSLPGQPKIWTSQGSFSKDEEIPQPSKKDFTIAKILSLAVVDAVNPCALAVLTLMLIAILTYNPTKKRNILLAGLAFIISVFIMYLIYGIIIIKSFQLVQTLTAVKFWLYKILGGAAIILGCFKLKDFFQAKAVCKTSPRVDKIISKITSPGGAFLIGAFVAVFLLPCTIGPYIICGGVLCPLGIFNAFPWLLFYNLIFVLPMVAVVLIIYLGLSRVKDVTAWQAKNIKYLDLIAGLIILGLGVAMILGLV